MPSTTLFRPLWLTFAAVVLAVGLAAGPVQAQSEPQSSGMVETDSGANPTAQSVTEQQLLQELNKITGRSTLPNQSAGLLQQPQGRSYQAFHEGWLPWIGAIGILGMLAALAIFFLSKGRIRTEESPETGIKIKRYNSFERLVHWMTATSFIVLAITGLNYFFGKRVLMPLLGPDAFATWSYWAKIAHNYIAWAFMLGIVLMLLMWIKDNLPDRYDWAWIRSAGGMFSRQHVPAGRFNAGQKLIFWTVVIGGIVLSASGIILLFPLLFVDINGMQWAQYIHAVTAVVMIAVILAHIYLGTLGMEGAFEAMGTGEVDLAWAREHHSAWVEKMETRAGLPPRHAAPAE